MEFNKNMMMMFFRFLMKISHSFGEVKVSFLGNFVSFRAIKGRSGEFY